MVVGALQRSIALLLLPIYAQVLSPSEFGEIGVIVSLTTGLVVLLSFGLETAIFRGFRMSQHDPSAEGFVNTVGGFAVLMPIALATAAAVIVGPPLAGIVEVSAEALALGSVAAGFIVATTLAPLTLLRAQERLGAYLRVSLVQVVATAGLTLIFVVALGWGVEGWMAAATVASVLTFVLGLAVLGHRWSTEFDPEALRRALAFGAPLVPYAFALWALAASDRAIMGATFGAEAVGGYFAAFQVCIPITLAAMAISQGTQPLFADLPAHPRHAVDASRVATSHMLLVLLAAAAVFLVGPPAVDLLLPASYGGAGEFIPWLAIGACLFGLHLMPMNAISIASGRTGQAWAVTGVAAIANVTLNLVLIPRFGPLAAAINTVVGYAILFVGMQALAERLCKPPLRYELRRLVVGGGLTVAACAIGQILAPIGGATELLLRTGIAVGLTVVLLTVGPLRREARAGLDLLTPRRTSAT